MFELKINALYWINETPDDEHDLCLHGNVCVIIGNEEFTDSCTVSAAALFLLRTLTEDHFIGQENQMLPCCGHFMIPDETKERVYITGCASGVDWTVLHDGDDVILMTEKELKTVIGLAEYKRIVFDFADVVENYYKQCSSKIIEDDFTQEGYTVFWNEWHRRRYC